MPAVLLLSLLLSGLSPARAQVVELKAAPAPAAVFAPARFHLSLPRAAAAEALIAPALRPAPSRRPRGALSSLSRLASSLHPRRAAVRAPASSLFFDGAPARPLAPEGILAPGGWLPENRQRLERLIREYGKGGPRWDPRHPPVAAFDWDGTMIIGDAGDALFFHLIREMGFKFSDGDRFWGLIPEEFGRGAIRASYEEIKGLPLGEAKKTAAYRRYRKLFHRAYLMEQERSGRLHSGFGWPLELMSGLTVQEVERASEEALRRELSVPLGEEIVSEGPQDPSPIRIAAGVRPAAEMFDLASRLQEHGWDVRIVSGSNEWIVAAFAALAGIPRSRVHGALSRINGGRLTAEVVQKSWARGKARVLQERALKPLLAAGDGPYDEELLRLSSGERLVIDRGAQNLLSLAKRRGWMVQPPFPAAGE